MPLISQWPTRDPDRSGQGSIKNNTGTVGTDFKAAFLNVDQRGVAAKNWDLLTVFAAKRQKIWASYLPKNMENQKLPSKKYGKPLLSREAAEKFGESPFKMACYLPKNMKFEINLPNNVHNTFSFLRFENGSFQKIRPPRRPQPPSVGAQVCVVVQQFFCGG